MRAHLIFFIQEVILTKLQMPDTSVNMARPKQYEELTRIRLLKGTMERISDAVRDGEDRHDFIRDAIDHYIELRKLTAQVVKAEHGASISHQIIRTRDALERAQEALNHTRIELEQLLPLHVEEERSASKRRK
jgi:hypothetical protein